MVVRRVRATVAWTAVLAVLALASVAHAQPGQPQVVVNPDNSLIISYPATGAPPAGGAVIAATYNGGAIPGSPFNIGPLTTVTAGPVAPGSYTIQIFWDAVASPPQTFIVGGGAGPLTAPILHTPSVAGNTVTLAWTPGSGNASGYDIEATVQATGQVLNLPVGNQTSLSVPNVPAGNFIVRIRARNAFGVSDFSTSVIVVVGVVLGQGDMQVTLTWNSTADIDLHVIEPNGTHVYYVSRNGVTARLDVDDTNGYGPENIFVSAGSALPGTYQIYLVHYGNSVPTTSTVAVTLGAGTPNARTAFFTRQTNTGSPSTGFNVADVNIGTGQVVETTGIRTGDLRTPAAPKSR